jgi:virulence-associated protein VapD
VHSNGSPNRTKAIQVNFDLDTKKLDAVFGTGKYRKGYALIKRYLENNGFEHRQWSGYRSLSAVSTIHIIDIINEMSRALPWFLSCAHKIDVTNIGREFDMIKTLRDMQDDETPDIQIELNT